MRSLDDRDPMLGRVVAQRYRLIERLGTGGMASVYLARHVLIDRLSAIKIVHPDLGNDAVYRARFLREAKAVNRINHPNIVEITDYGEADGLVFLVMEYVPGETLLRALDRGPIGWRKAASVGHQIASALGRAHQMGVIHRDLKPSNILLLPRRSGELFAKLTDFGVAKLADATTLTSAMVALGTPGYVAPEYQTLGTLDARADLYSLGVVLYQATTGTIPAPDEHMHAHTSDAPAFFDDVVATLLALDPDDRPRDGFEAADLLRRALETEGMRAPSPSGASLTPAPPHAEPSSPDATRTRRGPHLTTLAPEKIAPVCASALATIDARLAATPTATAAARAAASEAHKLTTMVEAIATLCEQDQRTIDELLARGREVRATLGRRIDDLARERSKALGWAGTVAERAFQLESDRRSGTRPTSMVDALVWEQAALETAEDEARANAARLDAQMRELDADLTRATERGDRELATVRATLEGRVGALRSVALEAWLALEEAARRLDLPGLALAL